jgi:phosphoribosylaminoimidazole carboxylase
MCCFFAVVLCAAARLAYDGRGNYVIKGPEDLTAGVQGLGGFSHGLYAEKWAPFVKELAVMVVRSSNGTVVSYPVVETIHKNNICHVTEAPAGVPAAIQQRAQQVAETAVACLYGAGIFGCVAEGAFLKPFKNIVTHCRTKTDMSSCW